MFPLPSIAIPVGLMNSPLPLPGAPHCNTDEHGGSVVEVDADVVVLVVEVVVLVMEVLVEVVVVDEVTAEVEVVVVVVVSPQSGGVGFGAALHAATSDVFSSLHAFLQTLSLPQPDLHALASATICFLQSLRHLARAGDAVSPPPTSSIANPTDEGTPAFIMDLGAGASCRRRLGVKKKKG